MAFDDERRSAAGHRLQGRFRPPGVSALRRSALGRDGRGAAALDFAVVASAFLTLLLLLMETCWQVAVAAALDSGAREASRWAATGQAPPEGETAAGHVNGLILKASGLPLDGAALVVTVASYPGFDKLATPGAGKPGLGGPGDILQYTVVYRSRGLTPVGQALLPAGMLQIRFVILVKNEPYPVG